MVRFWNWGGGGLGGSLQRLVFLLGLRADHLLIIFASAHFPAQPEPCWEAGERGPDFRREGRGSRGCGETEGEEGG